MSDKVWKVFDKYAGKLTSIGTIYPHELIYDPEHPTRHPNIFVFESEEAARAWITSPRKASLWECETTQTKTAPRLILKAHHVNQYFEEYWEAVQQGDPFPAWMAAVLKEPPQGTLLVDDLKLIQPLAL